MLGGSKSAFHSEQLQRGSMFPIQRGPEWEPRQEQEKQGSSKNPLPGVGTEMSNLKRS